MILFNSDYTEGAHPRILERLMETNLEQTTGYGEDAYCEAAREAIRKVCDAPEADVHFLVGGTQAKFTVISSALKPGRFVCGYRPYQCTRDRCGGGMRTQGACTSGEGWQDHG